jgi:hypothetical protein
MFWRVMPRPSIGRSGTATHGVPASQSGRTTTDLMPSARSAAMLAGSGKVSLTERIRS